MVPSLIKVIDNHADNIVSIHLFEEMGWGLPIEVSKALGRISNLKELLLYMSRLDKSKDWPKLSKLNRLTLRAWTMLDTDVILNSVPKGCKIK